MPAWSPLFVVVVWSIPVVFVWLMLRRPSDRSVAAFAKTYDVALTTGNVDQVRRYIQWTRRWRLGGVVVASVIAVVISMLTQRGGFGWMPLVVGYGAGTLVGELLRPAERSSAGGIASLERRGVRDFVVPRFLAVVAVVFVAGLLPALFLLLDNPQRSWVDTVDPLNQVRYRPQDWFVLALVAVSIAALAIAWVSMRRWRRLQCRPTPPTAWRFAMQFGRRQSCPSSEQPSWSAAASGPSSEAPPGCWTATLPRSCNGRTTSRRGSVD